MKGQCFVFTIIRNDFLEIMDFTSANYEMYLNAHFIGAVFHLPYKKTVLYTVV